jgi:hypothetical protein
MYRKKVMTTALAILAIATAVSLITASSGSGLVTSAFAVKKSANKNDTTSGTSNTGDSATGSKSEFIKCVTAISGSSPTRAEVDKCWDQVFGSGSASTLGASSTGRSSSGSSVHGSVLTLGSST